MIFEALSVGCIPVISDQTPWSEIRERKAGYVLPLKDDMKEFIEALYNLSSLSTEEKAGMSDKAVRIATEKVEQARIETGYRTIFG